MTLHHYNKKCVNLTRAKPDNTLNKVLVHSKPRESDLFSPATFIPCRGNKAQQSAARSFSPLYAELLPAHSATLIQVFGTKNKKYKKY